MSSIGLVGLTAYFGAFDVSKLKREHTVVVSGAAGQVPPPPRVPGISFLDLGSSFQCRRINLCADCQERHRV